MTVPHDPASGLVLIVDDDPDILEVFRWSLAEGGLRGVTCAGGAAALRYLAENARPALVISDLNMAEMTGEEFIRAARTSVGPRLKILVASATTDVSRRAHAAGANGFLLKPVDLDDLIDVSAALIEGRAPRGAGGRRFALF